jgi:Ca-activated chloride channel family protein
VKGLGSVCLVLAGTLCLAAEVAAQSPVHRPIYQSTASLVALNVTVQDASRKAKYVTNLGPADFAVFEDGVRQDVRFFESDAVPVDLIVLLDTSSSMGDKMNLVHEAANGFLHTLRPGDRGAVVAFSDNVDVLQPLTGDLPRLEQAVLSTRAHGSTALNNAIYIALKEFGNAARQSGDVRRQAIAVLSDGQDTASLVSFDDVLAVARQMGVNIYTVGLQSTYQIERTKEETGRRFFSESDYTLKTLARETGALSFFPTVTDLKSVYASIAQELAHQYSIGYVPRDSGIDGKFHKVVVQVVSRPDLRPRTRLGYTANGLSSSDYPPIP